MASNKPQALGWRGATLLIPSIASAIGLFCFAVRAYTFTEVSDLPEAFMRGIVVVGAFSLAFGAEIGTLAAVVDIYRKGGPAGWDWLALGFSLATTVTGFILAFASLLLRDLVWVNLFMDYGVVLLGALATLDAYGGFMEFGLYLQSYDERLAQWERREFDEAERRGRMAALVIDTEQDTAPIPVVLPLSVTDRRAALTQYMKETTNATQTQAAEYLGVSPSTVRNDIRAMEAKNVSR